MPKINLGIIFGGISTEHDVSVASGQAVVEHINMEKYNVFPTYIDKDGKWYEYKNLETESENEVCIEVYEKYEIKNIVKYLRKLDMVFPVLHGKYGEDGSIQGMLEMFNIPYVGNKVLASSIAMDKVYTKFIIEKVGIKQAKYIYIKYENGKYKYVENDFEEQEIELNKFSKNVKKELRFPMFVKPANYGSSVGITKAKNMKQLIEAIKLAGKLDKKILIEENIVGKEIECAVIGTKEIKASCAGQIIPADDFYTYDAKYKNNKSKLVIPANIDCEEEVKEIAIKAFNAIDGHGLARVDFFVTANNEIYLNEINTMPGFTTSSMFPKLWEASGMSFTEILDIIIEDSINIYTQ